MKNSLSLTAALVLFSAVAWATGSSTSDSRSSSPPPSGEVTLLYNNSDYQTTQPQANMNIRPDFKLVNHTGEPIAYSRIKVRYWLTAELRYGEGLSIGVTYASMGDHTITASAGELPSPRD